MHTHTKSTKGSAPTPVVVTASHTVVVYTSAPHATLYIIPIFVFNSRDCVFSLSYPHTLDPRTRDWPMMSSPFPTLGICLLYAYIVKVSFIPKYIRIFTHLTHFSLPLIHPLRARRTLSSSSSCIYSSLFATDVWTIISRISISFPWQNEQNRNLEAAKVFASSLSSHEEKKFIE